MDAKIRHLLEETKYSSRFPPRVEALRVKEEMNARGILNSSITAQQIAGVYLSNLEKTAECFTQALILNSNQLSLRSDEEIWAAIHDGYQALLTEARGCLSTELPGERDNFRNIAAATFEDRVPAVRDHLERLVKLRGLETGGSHIGFQMSGGQIGNLVLGSVSHAQLTASVQQIITQGGHEAELGRSIQSLIEAIGRMDVDLRAQQAELYDLVKGLLHQAKLPKDERSLGSIRATAERIAEVSKVSAELLQFIQQTLPQLLALFGLG